MLVEGRARLALTFQNVAEARTEPDFASSIKDQLRTGKIRVRH